MNYRQKIQAAFDAAIESGPNTLTMQGVTRPVNGGKWPAFKYGDASFHVVWIVCEPNIYAPAMGEDWETYEPYHAPALALQHRKTNKANGKRYGASVIRSGGEHSTDAEKLFRVIAKNKSYWFANPRQAIAKAEGGGA
jgi:hypothetical protein